jgi:enoyl-CoA hydratase/carnithine racemase
LKSATPIEVVNGWLRPWPWNVHGPNCAAVRSFSERREKKMDFWATDRRGAVEIATFSNPPYNYIDGPVIGEFAQLVAAWQDPSIRAVVIQSRPEDSLGFSQFSVDQLYALASDPAKSRELAPLVRGFRAIIDQMPALPKVIIAR